MKKVVFIVALILVSISYGMIKQLHVHLGIPKLKYCIDGMVYVKPMEDDDTLDETAGMNATFNGTFTDERGIKYPAQGNVSIADPALKNLEKIHFCGCYVNQSQHIGYHGILKVKAKDIELKRIPIKGRLNFTSGKRGKVDGFADNITLQEELENDEYSEE